MSHMEYRPDGSMQYHHAPAGDIPNLDAMEPDDLMEFWARHQRGRNIKAIFPEGRAKGTSSAVAHLASYAANKATAISCRLRGDIQSALMYEGFADASYKKLPEWSRW